MPAPVRYRSTAASYDEGRADSGTTRARGNRNAPPFSGRGRPFDCQPSTPFRPVAVNAYTSPRIATLVRDPRSLERRRGESIGTAAVNPAFTAVVAGRKKVAHRNDGSCIATFGGGAADSTSASVFR
jgi:hypothetical protein